MSGVLFLLSHPHQSWVMITQKEPSKDSQIQSIKYKKLGKEQQRSECKM